MNIALFEISVKLFRYYLVQIFVLKIQQRTCAYITFSLLPPTGAVFLLSVFSLFFSI